VLDVLKTQDTRQSQVERSSAPRQPRTAVSLPTGEVVVSRLGVEAD